MTQVLKYVITSNFGMSQGYRTFVMGMPVLALTSRSRVNFHRSTSSFHNVQHGAESMEKIRNIGIMAHIDAGKTTTTERMLYYSGFSQHLGNIDHGDTIMDYMEQERNRGITISSAAITFKWLGHKINLIDTPGHVDFTVEVERALRVLDGAVAVLDASAGVEAQTSTVWRQADHYHIPRIVYLNKMDKQGASLNLCLESLQGKLHVTPLVLNLPIGEGRNFKGVFDIINMKALVWDDKTSFDGVNYRKLSLTDAELDLINEARAELISNLADVDDHIANLVLCDTKFEDFQPTDLIPAIRKATIQHKFVPVLCGSSLKNKGVQPLLDAVTFYLPSPKDIDYGFAKYYGTHLCALAFKVIHDKQRGPLTFARIYAGMLKSGSQIYNINRSVSEKTSRLLQVYADELHDISDSVAGNIVAIAGLKQTVTGDTITSTYKVAKDAAQAYLSHESKDKDNVRMKFSQDEDFLEDDIRDDKDSLTDEMIPILAGLTVPDPVFFCSIEPSSITMQKHLDAALENLQKEDPSLKIEVNAETGQTVLAGMGELHLDIIKSRLEKEYNLEVDFGPLQIAYRETIEQSAEVTEILDKTLAGKQQYIQMKLSLHPDLEIRDFKHVVLERSHDHSLHIKPKHLRAIENGIKSGLGHGCLMNFPVIHASVHLHEFTTHYHTTIPMITACAAMAVQKALKQADCVLLEPMMVMEISTEEDTVDDVISDLASRRSHILEIKARQSTKVVKVTTPLKELLGYSTELRTLTSGKAFCTMELSHYEKMSRDEVQKVKDSISGFYSFHSK